MSSPLNPESQRLYDIAMNYHMFDDLDSAIKCYKQAIKLEPEAWDVWCDLGIAYGNIGRLDMAKFALEKALKGDPQNEIARMQLIALRGMPASTVINKGKMWR